MMHSKRRWGLAEVESAQALAKMLTQSTRTLCSGFFVAGHPEYLFLNDATHEDGALEIGVVKKSPDGSFLQVESITFSWATLDEARGYVEDALAGKFDEHDFARPVSPRIDAPRLHGSCPLCA
jgi:hypothetical protein